MFSNSLIQTPLTMKSSQIQLAGRGFVGPGGEAAFSHLGFDALLKLLESKRPTERTLAARLLAHQANAQGVGPLCHALVVEKKLYTKIEICNALAAFGPAAVESLMPLLGQIGNNQHKTIPQKIFEKKSFPLPRDIVARILIRMGPDAVPALANIMESGVGPQLSEAVDALGYLCFYDPTINGFPHLQVCYQRFQHQSLIVWKIVRAMGAFEEARDFLVNLYATSNHNGIKLEISRSLNLMDTRRRRSNSK